MYKRQAEDIAALANSDLKLNRVLGFRRETFLKIKFKVTQLTENRSHGYRRAVKDECKIE